MATQLISEDRNDVGSFLKHAKKWSDPLGKISKTN